MTGLLFAWWVGFLVTTVVTVVRDYRFAAGRTTRPVGFVVGGMITGDCVCGVEDSSHYSVSVPFVGSPSSSQPLRVVAAMGFVLAWHVLWFLAVPVQWVHNRRLTYTEEVQWNEDML